MSVIWHIAVVQYPNNKTEVKGVLLKRKPVLLNSKSGVLKSFRSIASSYFYSTDANKSIQVNLNNTTKTVISDSNGNFTAWFTCEVIENLHVTNKGNEKEIPLIQNYPYLFSKTNSGFDVISDIDDTIVKSYTLNIRKRISTILFKRPAKRKAVEYSSNLFISLKKYNPAFYFVSKSESNLFYLLSGIIESKLLPEGILFLTPYLKWYQLLKPKKGQDYKFNHISTILENSESKKFILLGDDTQGDMDVYVRIIRAFPGRIIHVYIRQARLVRTFKQLQKWERLQATNVAATYFSETDEFESVPAINIKEQL